MITSKSIFESKPVPAPATSTSSGGTHKTLFHSTPPVPKAAPAPKPVKAKVYSHKEKVEAIIRLQNLDAAPGVAFPEGTTSQEIDEAQAKVAQERANAIAWNRKTLGIGVQPDHIGAPKPNKLFT